MNGGDEQPGTAQAGVATWIADQSISALKSHVWPATGLKGKEMPSRVTWNPGLLSPGSTFFPLDQKQVVRRQSPALTEPGSQGGTQSGLRESQSRFQGSPVIREAPDHGKWLTDQSAREAGGAGVSVGRLPEGAVWRPLRKQELGK